MYVPRSVWDHAKQARWLNRGSWMRASDDGSQLTFTLGDDNIWHLVGDECEVPLPPRVLVNKKLKAKYKQGIADYLAWISAMAPMLQTDDWQYRSQMRTQVQESKDTGATSTPNSCVKLLRMRTIHYVCQWLLTLCHSTVQFVMFSQRTT